MKSDPITFAVIKNALDSIVDEVAYTVIRTARSEIVKEVMDYSAALCDAEGKMIAQAKTIALHLGAIPEAMVEIQKRYKDDLHPGDAIILNDPYKGGTHLPDIFMFFPVFNRETLCGFVVVICHHTDMGGRVPGSNGSDSTEIFQEGLRIPPMKLYEKEKLNSTLFELIGNNVRLPEIVIGDLKAQYAACRVGAKELNKLIDNYGVDEIKTYMNELLDHAERLTRQEIARWPNGTYEFTDYLDNDGVEKDKVVIKVMITVHDDYLTVDYSGSHQQVAAALNSTKSYTNSCTYLSVACVLENNVPNNQGLFRCIDVIAPKGTILNPNFPGACAARALTGYRVVDTMLGALSQIVPKRVPAAGEGGNTVVCIGGNYENRKPFIIVDMICGAWGGRPNKDGIEAITNPSQNLSNTPVEIMEAKYPVRIEEYSLIPNSGGAGKWRGGLGISRSYRILNEDVSLQLRADRVCVPPYGLYGGKPGRFSFNYLERNGQMEEVPGKVTTTLKRGDLIKHEQAGGGGHGDSYSRDTALVADDVWNGKITVDHAEEKYGVVFKKNIGEVDTSATKSLRKKHHKEKRNL